jgi:hypothetical protein
MNAATEQVPSSPSQHYCTLRAGGSTHEAALHAAAHAYQTTPRELLDSGVARLWEELERSEPVADAPRQEVPQPDPLDTTALEITNRQEALEADRQRLSLDAISDNSARADLVKVEREIAELRAEAERVALAKIEGNRREREAREIAEREAKEEALQRANDLGEQRQKADAKLIKTASDFANALAAVEGIAAQQSEALSDAGQGWRSLAPSAGQLQRIVAAALIQAGAQAQWLT